ncbi:MAG: glycosyltransferase, partial [Chloroflexi bacterium]|nr:glycosyltransferase [Chloroflexota bacterium]
MRVGLDVTAAVRQGAGIGRYTRELLRALARLDGERRYRLFAASTRPSPHPLPPLPGNFSFRLLPFHDIWLARAWGRLDLPLPVELILGRVDLFHSPDFTLPPTLPGVPTLLTVHDLSFEREPGSAAPGLPGYLRRVVPRSVRRASRVLADSQATRADLMALYGTPPEKVEVLYPGVDPIFRPAPAEEQARVRARYHLGEAPFVLTVSTLQPRKNHARL